MPVRIYDISKKLGLENKEVLAKAKALGIAARVASSSLDKITAEYLEQQIVLEHPHLLAPKPAAAPATIAPNEPIVILSAPPPEPESAAAPEIPEAATTTALLEPEPTPTETVVSEVAPPAEEAEVSETPPPVPPEPPKPPPQAPVGPKVGDKIGFIQLPPKPGPKPAEKAGPAKLPARPVEPRRTDFTKRGDIRSVRGAPIPPAGPAVHGARIPAQQKSQGGPSKAP